MKKLALILSLKEQQLQKPYLRLRVSEVELKLNDFRR
jgi:hypothetical protein